MNSSGTVFEYH